MNFILIYCASFLDIAPRLGIKPGSGRFVAQEGVKGLHPSPTNTLATKPEDHDERRVAVVVKAKKTKQQRRRQRGAEEAAVQH